MSSSTQAIREGPDKEETGEVQYLAIDLPGCWPDERSLISSSTCAVAGLFGKRKLACKWATPLQHNAQNQQCLLDENLKLLETDITNIRTDSVQNMCYILTITTVKDYMTNLTWRSLQVEIRHRNGPQKYAITYSFIILPALGIQTEAI